MSSKEKLVNPKKLNQEEPDAIVKDIFVKGEYYGTIKVYLHTLPAIKHQYHCSEDEAIAIGIRNRVWHNFPHLRASKDVEGAVRTDLYEVRDFGKPY